MAGWAWDSKIWVNTSCQHNRSIDAYNLADEERKIGFDERGGKALLIYQYAVCSE
jgi:hypothetical protein